jgi:hypothetical protein
MIFIILQNHQQRRRKEEALWTILWCTCYIHKRQKLTIDFGEEVNVTFVNVP